MHTESGAGKEQGRDLGASDLCRTQTTEPGRGVAQSMSDTMSTEHRDGDCSNVRWGRDTTCKVRDQTGLMLRYKATKAEAEPEGGSNPSLSRSASPILCLFSPFRL